MKYKIIKLEQPIFRSGRRKFTYKIVRNDGSLVFLFQDYETAEFTLENLGA